MVTYPAFLWLFLVWFGVQFSEQSAPDYPSYYAGVVEFEVSRHFEDNYYRMTEIIESEEARDLDILVFPELALSSEWERTFVPDPEQHIAPCDEPNYASFLTEVSCSARSRRTYVVLNVLEKVECDPNCIQECGQVFNTNVVFDRSGIVVARYRKTHLYRNEWYSTNVLERPEHAVFSTDFGVTFGIFTSWDILFHDPAMVLVKEMKLMDIICPMQWSSELPFFTSIQLQEGWAIANDVNLLASSTSGSGIYGGKLGRLNASISAEPSTRLLSTRVLKHNLRSLFYNNKFENYQHRPAASELQLETPRISKMSVLRDYNVDVFTTLLLSPDFSAAQQNLCHENFCCRFNIRRAAINNSTAHAAYRYRLAAYSGDQVTFQRADHADLSVCALLACTSDELWSCGRIFPENRLVGNKHYFTDLQISVMLKKADRQLIMPSTVDAMMMPLRVYTYKLKVEAVPGGYTYVDMALTAPKADILTFGIVANHYGQREAAHNLYSTDVGKSGGCKNAF